VSYSKVAKRIYKSVMAVWKPPKKMTLSEWANEYAYLSPESSAEPGKWKGYFYQNGIMDTFTDPTVEKITLMKAARTGYTKTINHAIGYHVHQDPCPMLIVQPTLDDAQGYSKDEIAPMCRDTPVLDGLIADAKSRSSNNTILKKNFPGGVMSIVGANSARGFRRLTVRVVFFDEVDGYPPTAGQEGDQIQLGIKRTDTFWNRKIVLGSTPTIKGFSRIETSFNESDQRYFHVPCPFCDHMQVLKFSQVKWPENEPNKAKYECVECKNRIPASKKRWMCDRGEWRASKPFKGHAGFHISALYSYSPNAAWGKIAEEFLEVKDDPERLKTFINTTLGETWEERGDQPEWVDLQNRCEPYSIMTVPLGGLMLTAGVDIQKNRLAAAVYAWGRGEECWLVYWGELFGDPARDEVWTQLDTLLNHSFRHSSGAEMQIISSAIDTGYHTQEAYNYCRKHAPKAMAVKGSAQANRPILGRPSDQDIFWNGQKIKNGVQLWPIGTDTAKSTIYSRLKTHEPGPRCFHWPIGIDEDYFQQLTAEKQVTRYIKGFPKREWVKTRPRNEALDVTVYAYAAAIRAGLMRMDWDAMEKELHPEKETEQRRRPQPERNKSNITRGRTINPWHKRRR